MMPATLSFFTAWVIKMGMHITPNREREGSRRCANANRKIRLLIAFLAATAIPYSPFP